MGLQVSGPLSNFNGDRDNIGSATQPKKRPFHEQDAQNRGVTNASNQASHMGLQFTEWSWLASGEPSSEYGLVLPPSDQFGSVLGVLQIPQHEAWKQLRVSSQLG